MPLFKKFAANRKNIRKPFTHKFRDSVPNDFDWMVYCTANRDLWDAQIRTYDQCLIHWKSNRRNEKRQTSLPDFDWYHYVTTNSLFNIQNRLDALNHWFTVGIQTELSNTLLDS